MEPSNDAATPTGPSAPSAIPGSVHLNPAELGLPEVYKLISGLVVPRPIAWVSSSSPDGVLNLAPYSFFNVVARQPPHVAFSSIGEKDTVTNARASCAFVVNLIDAPLLERLVATAAPAPPEIDEFTLAGVTPATSDVVAVPRVAEAAASLECVLERIVSLGDSELVIGQVVRIWVRDGLRVDGAIDIARQRPVGRVGGARYAPVERIIEHPTPRSYP